MTRNFLALLRPADALNFLSLTLLTVIVVLFSHRLPHAQYLIPLYCGMFLVQALLLLFRDKGRFMHWAYHLIFPTISILAIFDSLEYIVHYVNPQDIDPLLIKLDFLLFGGHPTVMMERIMHPLLTDLLQIAYSSYYFLAITLGAVLLIRKDEKAFDRSLFLIMFCFYLSYAGYLIFPALGPRFTMNHLQNAELQGLLVGPIQELLNRLEGIKRDAFPSGHTGIALTVLFLAFKFEKKLFWIFVPFVSALIFSTVYLRYHYVVDVLAGIILTALTLFFGGIYYGYWEKRIHPDR
ncbi:MAG: phosphatase PAP2 family protein [Nitrospirota bacterium]|nr:phosphatase PAP2 family protein [Nitrospirota bacterium]